MSENDEVLAAIDLGSNSFHMVLAHIVNDQIQVVDQYKEMVRLAGGLDKRQRLTKNIRETALECLQRFGQRLSGMPAENVRIVGTNTLRKAKNSAEFIATAEAALGYPIEIISGMEEARLIYLGVAHFLPTNQGKRLVIDIGGGSTEIIIGEKFKTLQRESLHMGCVSLTQQYFGSGKITKKAWKLAVQHAKLELRPIVNTYRDIGWQVAIGASGTLKSVASVQEMMGWATPGVMTRAGMKQLKNAILDFDTIKSVQFAGLSERRQPVFVGGAAIVYALFSILKLEEMLPSAGALREGVLYDLSGRRHHQDVRGRTIDHLFQRFHISTLQAERVMRLLVQLMDVGDEKLALPESDIAMLLWAAELHEIGRAVAHSHYHKHGAYLIEHADLPGFSRREQKFLATLIRLQRRKISVKFLDSLADADKERLQKLLLLFRLALILCRERSDEKIAVESIQWKKNDVLEIKFNAKWLEDRPLTQLDIEQEQQYLQAVGLNLTLL